MGVDPEPKKEENTGRNREQDEAREEWRKLARISASITVAGFQMAIFLAIGTFLGNWIDEKIGKTGPFTIVGAVAGFGLGLYLVVRTLKRL